MPMFGRIVLVALAIALWKPSVSQRDPFNYALRCVRRLVDFHLMAQYHSHTTETLKYLDNYLRRFHAKKKICLKLRQWTTSKRKSEGLDKGLRNQYAQEEANNTNRLHDVGMRSKRQQLDSSRKEEPDALQNEIIEDDSHFNYPKMYLLIHFHNHNRLFGNLLMYSTKIQPDSTLVRETLGNEHATG